MSTAAPVLAPRRTAKFGLGWSAAAQVGGSAVRLGSTLFLTRLLAPDAYALIGTALVVLTTLEWLSDVGIVPALVRHPDGGRPDWLLTGWWAGLGRGAGLSAVAALAAAPLAAFYHQPELATVMLALAVRPALFALRSPGVPLLRRNLEARALFADELTQAVIGAAAAIAVAAAVPGAGAWALVTGALAGTAAGVVASYWLAPMAPRWHWDRGVARHLAAMIPLTAAVGVVGLAAAVLASTVAEPATQAALAPELGRRAVGRVAAAAGWAGLGLAGAAAVERLLACYG